MDELRARRDLHQGFGNAMGQAIELVGAPVLFALLGLLLDHWLGLTPVLTVILGGYGLVGGVLRIYYGYAEKMRAEQEGKPWTRLQK